MINNFKSIQLFITKRCNLNCQYCFVLKSPQEDMTIETAKTIIDKVENKLCFDFFGGEATLRLDFIKEVMDYASSKPIHFKIFTNGFIYDENFKYLIKNYPLIPRTSFDGLIDSNLQRASYEQSKIILFNIIDMNKNFNDLIISSVVNPSNYLSLTSNMNFLLNQGFKYINVIFDRISDWSLIDPTKFTIIFSEFIDWYIENFNNINLISIDEMFYRFSFPPKSINNVNVKYMEKVVTVNYNGDIYPAEMLINNPDCKIGNIIENIFDLEKSKSLYRKIELKQCQECLFFNKCRICQRDLITCGNSLDDVYNNLCLLNQNMYVVLMTKLTPFKTQIKNRLNHYKQMRGFMGN